MVSRKDKFLFYDNKDCFQKAIVNKIMSYANEAILENGKFSIVLSGGSTPESIYDLLSEKDCDWNRWHIYFGDERCLSAVDIDRNSVMVRRVWLSKVNIPDDQVFIIPGELGNQIGANKYEKELDKNKPFDLILLGLGVDGHIASLFPGQLHDENRQVVPVYDAPKEPRNRISLTLSRLCNTQNTIFIISGKNKLESLKRLQSGKNHLTNNIGAINELSVFYCDIS